LHISIVEASYTTTVFILAAGVAPVFFAPIANVYGRRPIYLFFTIIAIATNFGSAVSQKWIQVVATRVLNGIGASAAPGLGAATVCDLYYLHERGFYMGIYTVPARLAFVDARCS
jgi:MFS family permease